MFPVKFIFYLSEGLYNWRFWQKVWGCWSIVLCDILCGNYGLSICSL